MKDRQSTRRGPVGKRLGSLGALGALGVFVAALGLACAPLRPPTSAQGSAKDGGGGYRIAIAHVTMAENMQHQRTEDRTLYSSASTDIGSYFEHALLKRRVEVVRAHHTAGILPVGPPPHDFHRDASRLARATLESFDADALLVVELTRWSPRDMRIRRRSPAAVAFRATLHGGPEGLLLWSGEFSERQVTFFDDPWQAIQYPGWGTRWLTANELAQWGARRLAGEIPLRSERR